MIQAFHKAEFDQRVALNRSRLAGDEYYQIQQVFSPGDYQWYGDKEGRALLAFVSHYKLSGEKLPCMDALVAKLPDRANEFLFFGPLATDILDEQQLSGHSWLLRGLCEYHGQFHDDFSLKAIRSIVKHLYLPARGRFHTYPVHRAASNTGGVSGSSTGVLNGWKLSSDIGCGFMSIDGLSQAYEITLDPAVKDLLDEMIGVYGAIDKAALQAQTHCTLTAARGMMRMYDMTKDPGYLRNADNIFDLYVNGGGMTYTYQNLNWWGRPDSWTEPCAVIDSLMLALMLYKATGNELYRTYAARIYANGFASLQRGNGGAGTDHLVCPGSGRSSLSIRRYEAPFCCTMRLAEGLWYIGENTELLYTQVGDEVIKNETGIYMCGDYIYAEISDNAMSYAEKTVWKDGHRLSPLLKYYKLPDALALETRQQILF